MKRLDEGKVSWSDFLRSIKFTHNNKPDRSEGRSEGRSEDNDAQFADFVSHARSRKKLKEERYLVRSAN